MRRLFNFLYVRICFIEYCRDGRRAFVVLSRLKSENVGRSSPFFFLGNGDLALASDCLSLGQERAKYFRETLETSGIQNFGPTHTHNDISSLDSFILKFILSVMILYQFFNRINSHSSFH